MSATLPTIYGVKIYLRDFQQPVTANATLGLFNRIATLSQQLNSNSTMLKTFNVAPFEVNEAIQIYKDVNTQETNIITGISPTMNALFLLHTSTNLYPANTTQVQAASVFRVCQNDIVNPNEAWKSGVLMQNGIGNFSRKIDLRRMGNIATPGDCTVQFNNTNKFYQEMKNRGIYFNGLVAKIIKFTGNIEVSRWMGECQKPSWTSKRYIIPMKGLYNKRIASCSTTINNDPITGNFPNASDDKNGNIIPITIGSFLMVGGNPQCAKFVRISDVETPLINDTNILSTLLPSGQTVFPIIATGTAPAVTYTIQLGLSGSGYAIPNLVGMWMKVIIGGSTDGKSQVGRYRQITAASLVDQQYWLDVTINSVFEEDLADTGTYQAWVSIVSLNYQFYGDMWPLKGFYDLNGNIITNGVSLFAYNTAQDTLNYQRTQVYDARGNEVGINLKKQIGFTPIAKFGYNVVQGMGGNILQLNPLMCDGDPNVIYSFDIFPLLSTITRYAAANASAWGLGTDDIPLNPVRSPNIYCNDSSMELLGYTIISVGSVNPSNDQNDSTFEQHQFGLSFHSDTGHTIWAVYEIQIDMSKILIEYSNYFLGLNIKTGTNTGGGWNIACPLKIRFRRFLGPITDILDTSVGQKYQDQGGAGGQPFDAHSSVNNLPDYYYINRGHPDNNLAFYQIASSIATQLAAITGYSAFPLTGITSIELLRSIYRIGIISGVTQNSGSQYAFFRVINFNELAIICQKQDNIADDIFVLCAGRIFNSTWGGRKTPTDLIADPVNTLEHFCRLQNGSENGIAPYAGWGKGYWENAPIKITGDGSFDDAGLTALKVYQCSGQITDAKNAATNVIKKKLCYQFGMVNYVDGDGNECVKPLQKSLTSPSDTITLAQIIDRSSIKVYEPDPADVYPEPYINYNFNIGSGNYDGLIKVMNTDYENPTLTQKGFFVQGCRNAETASNLWGLCYNLMQRVHNIEPPPGDMTDLDFIRDYDTALAHLTDWINWMYNPEIEFKCSSVQTGADAWLEAHRFILSLPHQTNDISIECILEEITVNPNNEHEVLIKAIMLSDTIPQGFNFEDSIQSGALGWQDTIQSGAQGEQAVIS